MPETYLRNLRNRVTMEDDTMKRVKMRQLQQMVEYMKNLQAGEPQPYPPPAPTGPLPSYPAYEPPAGGGGSSAGGTNFQPSGGDGRWGEPTPWPPAAPTGPLPSYPAYEPPGTILSPGDQYLQDNPDVARDPFFKTNPLAHYQRYGKNEGRNWLDDETLWKMAGSTGSRQDRR